MPKLENSITLGDFSSTDIGSLPINAQDSLLGEGGHTHPTSIRSVASKLGAFPLDALAFRIRHNSLESASIF